MSKRLGIVAALLAIVVLAAACGGGGGNNGNDAAAPASSGDAQRIEIAALEPFAYSTNTVEVNRGTTVEIVLKNEGALAHDLHIDEFGVTINPIAGGQTASVKFTPDKVGEYKIYCAEPGHDAGGMNAVLKVI